MRSQAADVIIVGGGLVGLTTALLLAQARLGMDIVLLDAQAPKPLWADIPGHWDIRSSAITRATQQVWQSLGVWAACQAKRVAPYTRMSVYDAAGFGALHFSATDIAEPDLGHIVENQVILSSLWSAVLAAPDIQVLAPASLSHLSREKKDQIFLHQRDGQILSTPLLIGADGPHSWVRTQAKIACDKSSYQQSAILMTVRSAFPHEQRAWQRFLPSGPLAFLPLADPYLSSIVWTQASDLAAQCCAQALTQQAADLMQASGRFFGELTCLQAAPAFPLQKQHAKQYVQPGVALLGDAAHVIHPLAGQGVNLGIADAAVLVALIAERWGKRQAIGDYWGLRPYERQRRPVVSDMMGLVSGLNSLFQSSSSVVRSLRSVGMAGIDNSRLIKGWLSKRALGII